MKPSSIIYAFLLLLYLAPGSALAQSAASEQKAASKHTGRNSESLNHYQTEAQSWQQVVLLNPFNANAWYQLYAAQRSALLSSEKKITPATQKTLDVIAAEITQKVPGTFESELVIYLNGNKNMKLFPHLQKAYELSPSRIETYPEFIAYYELAGDKIKRQEFCSRLYYAKYFQSGIMSYNYNMLMSLEQNAIIFTNGEFDTYPVWMLQSVEEVRKDVTIINSGLLENPVYRKRIISEAGLALNEHTDDLYNTSTFIHEILAANPDKPLYFSLTLSKTYITPVFQQLYVTGLAFRYSPVIFENLPVLKENLERRFRAIPGPETINNAIQSKNTTTTDLDVNYLVPMLILYDYYIENKEKQKAEKLRISIELIARYTKREAIVSTYLKSKR